MNKKTTVLLMTAFLILSVSESIMTALPLIKPINNISHTIYGGNKKVWDIEPDGNGTVYVAASEELCIWDGQEWSSIKAFSCIRDLHWDTLTRRLYACGDNYFGYWSFDSFGRLDFKLLYFNEESIRKQLFWRIIPTKSGLYVQTHECIFSYNEDGNELNVVIEGNVGYIITHNNYVLGQVDGKLYKFSGSDLSESGISTNDRIVDARYIDNNIVYITEYGGIFIYDGQNAYELFPELNGTLRDVRVFSAKIMDDGSFLLGTVLDGVYIVDNEGKTKEHFNTKNGLKYSTVLCLSVDNQNTYWFGLDGGLASYDKYDYALVYDSKDRDIGDVYSSIIWNNRLYLGTNEGLYWADEYGITHKIKGLNGITWRLENCGEFLAAEIDGVLYTVYPDGHYKKVLANIENLSSWKGIDNLYWCSNSQSILLLEKKNGELIVRNCLSTTIQFTHVPVINDNLGNLWVHGLNGGVQRLSLDPEKRTILSTSFYEAGTNDHNCVKAFYVDKNVVFVSGKDCYLYNVDTDELTYSTYYSNLCKVLERDVVSFYQKGNKYFNYDGRSMFLIQRNERNSEYFPQTLKYTAQDFSENYSTFTELNDSLVAIGCNNGLVVFNANIQNRQVSTNLEIAQCCYDVDDETRFSILSDIGNVNIPYNATNNRLKIRGLSHYKTVYYSIDNRERYMISGNSYVFVPHLNGGNHSIIFTGADGDELLSFGIRVERHWMLSWWFILLCLTSLVAIILLARKIYHLKVEERRKGYESEMAKQMEQERIKYENEKLSSELCQRNAKLTTLALNDITVNNMLKEIETEILKVSEKSKELKTDLQPLKRIVERYFRENGSWSAFETYFNCVYDGFFDRLRAKYPQLTQNDLKICSYIRLGMSTKEIASLMNIEVSSAESARYRLRKNIGLTANESLSALIQSI